MNNLCQQVLTFLKNKDTNQHQLNIDIICKFITLSGFVDDFLDDLNINDVLKRITKMLNYVSYKKDTIITQNTEKEKVFFVLSGYIDIFLPKSQEEITNELYQLKQNKNYNQIKIKQQQQQNKLTNSKLLQDSSQQYQQLQSPKMYNQINQKQIQNGQNEEQLQYNTLFPRTKEFFRDDVSLYKKHCNKKPGDCVGSLENSCCNIVFIANSDIEVAEIERKNVLIHFDQIFKKQHNIINLLNKCLSKTHKQDEIRQIAKLFKEKQVRQNEILFYEGENTKQIYLIKCGNIEIKKKNLNWSKQTKEKSLSLLNNGKIIGNEDLLTQYYTAICASQSAYLYYITVVDLHKYSMTEVVQEIIQNGLKKKERYLELIIRLSKSTFDERQPLKQQELQTSFVQLSSEIQPIQQQLQQQQLINLTFKRDYPNKIELLFPEDLQKRPKTNHQANHSQYLLNKQIMQKENLTRGMSRNSCKSTDDKNFFDSPKLKNDQQNIQSLNHFNEIIKIKKNSDSDIFTFKNKNQAFIARKINQLKNSRKQIKSVEVQSRQLLNNNEKIDQKDHQQFINEFLNGITNEQTHDRESQFYQQQQYFEKPQSYSQEQVQNYFNNGRYKNNTKMIDNIIKNKKLQFTNFRKNYFGSQSKRNSLQDSISNDQLRTQPDENGSQKDQFIPYQNEQRTTLTSWINQRKIQQNFFMNSNQRQNENSQIQEHAIPQDEFSLSSRYNKGDFDIQQQIEQLKKKHNLVNSEVNQRYDNYKLSNDQKMYLFNNPVLHQKVNSQLVCQKLKSKEGYIFQKIKENQLLITNKQADLIKQSNKIIQSERERQDNLAFKKIRTNKKNFQITGLNLNRIFNSARSTREQDTSPIEINEL